MIQYSIACQQLCLHSQTKQSLEQKEPGVLSVFWSVLVFSFCSYAVQEFYTDCMYSITPHDVAIDWIQFLSEDNLRVS